LDAVMNYRPEETKGAGGSAPIVPSATVLFGILTAGRARSSLPPMRITVDRCG
jgi:hypothetical protein